MGSLYRRAQTFLTEYDARRAALKIVRKDELSVEDDREISAEDRTKIMGQIDEVVARSRIAITPDTFRVVPKRRGWLFPTVVNLVAVVVVAGGILLAIELGRRTEQSIIAAPTGLATAEGKLLEAFKEESRQELEGKDREIADIRERLVGIDQEKERIRLAAEQTVLTREQQLREEFARSLEAERTRLAATGLGAAAIEDRIAELEQANTRELETQLQAARAQAEAERAEQERTVERLREEYERTLTAAQGERTRLADEAAKRQADLEAGSRQRQLALEQEKGQALSELATLRRQQENEQLVLDQFLTYYRKARDAMQARDTATARGVLADFRKYMDEPTVAGLPGVSRRRQVELFLISSLEETLARLEGEAASRDTTQSLVASANLVTAVAELVQQGEGLFLQQDYTRARDLYLAALSRIPAVQTGQARLAEIERIFADRARTDLAALMATANEAYRAGDYQRAVASYSEALVRLQGERGTVDTLVAQLSEIGARGREAQLAPRIQTLERELAAQTESARGLAGQVAARATELEGMRAELESIRGTLGEREGELATRTTERDQVRAELAQARVRIGEQETALGATTAERDQALVAGQQLRSRVEQLASRRRTVTAAREAVESASAEAAANASPTPGREQLLALLQTKLQVQRVLLSDAVLREYPDLYEGNERYVQALVTERASQARLDALEDLDEVLARLTGGSATAEAPADLQTFTTSAERVLLERILARLDTLLE